jgi:hypothetical protein
MAIPEETSWKKSTPKDENLSYFQGSQNQPVCIL